MVAVAYPAVTPWSERVTVRASSTLIPDTVTIVENTEVVEVKGEGMEVCGV